MATKHLYLRFIGPRLATGIVLHDGEYCIFFGKGFYAVPLRRLWEAA